MIKSILIICHVLWAAACFGGQSDTALIREAVDYLNSAEFRNKCKDSVKAEYKILFKSGHMSKSTKKDWLKEEAADTNILMGNACFIPFNYYMKHGVKCRADTSVHAGLLNRQIIWPTMRSQSPKDCETRIIVVAYILSNNNLLLEYYSCANSIPPIGYKQGDSHIVELWIDEDNSIKFVHYRSMINN